MATTYRTRSMDTWDIISKEVYGSEMLINKLIEANTAYSDVFMFEDGVILTVPDVDAASSELTQNLPPWKRGTNDAS